MNLLTRTDTTLRVTRLQYRAFADQVKQFGCCLSPSTFRSLGNNWGLYSPMVGSVLVDASTKETRYDERAVIQLSTSVNTADLRRQARPEIDWSALDDHEIYPFIVAHELGHHIDNFSVWDVCRIEDSQARDRCMKVLRSINEVLADRYAWSQVRPGEPVPLCEYGKRLQEEVAADMELLYKHAPRVRRTRFRTCPKGQYEYVPTKMLLTNELVAFVGPAVSGGLVNDIRQRSRTYRRDTRSRA